MTLLQRCSISSLVFTSWVFLSTFDLLIAFVTLASVMDNMSALEQALNLLPVSVDDKAVKEAVISHLSKEICLHLRPHFPTSSFDIAEDSMKTSSCHSFDHHTAEGHCHSSHLCEDNQEVSKTC